MIPGEPSDSRGMGALGAVWPLGQLSMPQNPARGLPVPHTRTAQHVSARGPWHSNSEQAQRGREGAGTG